VPVDVRSLAEVHWLSRFTEHDLNKTIRISVTQTSFTTAVDCFTT